MILKADPFEVAIFFRRYLEQLPDKDDILERLRAQAEEIKDIVGTLTTEQQQYAYAPGKWIIKELFGHMIDTERIMAYRAMCIARGEKQSLPGFDENNYVAHARFADRELGSLFREYYLQRQSNMALFESFDEAMLQMSGTANNGNATTQGLITIIAAHEYHHLQILKQRYLGQGGGLNI